MRARCRTVLLRATLTFAPMVRVAEGQLVAVRVAVWLGSVLRTAARAVALSESVLRAVVRVAALSEAVLRITAQPVEAVAV
jgi:hypothetical protein